MEDHEKPLYERLIQALERLDPWLRRIDQSSGGFQLGAGSSLSGDDARTHPYEMSHAVWSSLSHAIDHLHMLRTCVRDARTIHLYAPYSVLRWALDNASAAVWMLAPASRSERLVRRLRLAAADIRGGERVKELIKSPGPRTREERFDDLRTIAAREGIDERQALSRVTYEEIVAAAGREITAGETLTEVLWRGGSGIGHGDLWATLSIPDRVEVPGAPEGVAHMAVTPGLPSLLVMTLVATELTAKGWALFDERSRRPY